MLNFKKINLQSLLFFLFFFILFFFLSIFYSNQDFLPCGGIKLNFTASKIAEICGGRDYTHYINLAKDYITLGHPSEKNAWVLKHWPIGPSFFYFVSILLVGVDGPVLLPILTLNVFIWSYIFTFLFSSIKSKNFYSYILLIILIISAVYSYTFKYFFLTYGIIDTAGGATFFFILSIISLIKILKKDPTVLTFKNYFPSSCFLAMSSLFRLNFDFSIYIGVFIFGFFIIFSYLRKIYINKKYFKFKLNDFENSSKIFKVFLFAFLLTLPFKLYHLSLFNAKSGSPFHIHWIPKSTLEEMGGGYVYNGGGSISCRVEPKLCKSLDKIQKYHEKNKVQKEGEYRQYWDLYFDKKIYAVLAIYAFLKNPLDWMYLKWIKIFPSWWFQNGMIEKSDIYNFFDKVFDLFCGLSLVFLIIILFFKIDKKLKSVIFFIMPILITYFIIFTVWHFEARYLLPLKAVSFFVFVYVIQKKYLRYLKTIKKG